MKILRATSRGELDKWYDEKALKSLDEEQGRRRLCGAEVEALIGFATADNLLDKCMPVLGDLIGESGQKRRASMISPMTRNMLYGLVRKVQANQLITIANNVNNVNITLSAVPTGGYCNIAWEHMQTICDQALATCQMGCDKSRDESKRCPVRKALDTVPGLREVRKSRGNTQDCPYADMSLEWEVPEA